MKKFVSLLIAVTMLCLSCSIETGWAASDTPAIIKPTVGSMPMADLSGYTEAALNLNVNDFNVASPKRVYIDGVGVENYVMTLQFCSAAANVGPTASFDIVAGNDVIRLFQSNKEKQDIWIDATISGQAAINESGAWSNRTHEIVYDIAETASQPVYDVYIEKTAAALTIGMKEAPETDYTWTTQTVTANEAGAKLQFINHSYPIEIKSSKLYVPAAPPVIADPMPEVTDFSNYDCMEFDFKPIDSSYGDTVLEGVAAKEYVLKFDYQAKGLANESYANFRIVAGNDCMRVFPKGGYIALNSVATGGNPVGDWNIETYRFNHSTENNTEKIYSVYMEKTEATIVFGIKERGADEYAWFTTNEKVAPNAQDAQIQFGTFGYPIVLSNIKAYTRKEEMPPMPEVTDFSEYNCVTVPSVLIESDYGETLMEGVSTENYVLKFDYKAKGAASDSWANFRIVAGNDCIRIFPKGGYIAVNAVAAGQNPVGAWNVETDRLKYAVANDTETVYSVYMEKAGEKLVFGIKEQGAAEYAWFAPAAFANDKSAQLKFGTFGYMAELSSVQVYTPKEKMPEITDFSNYTKINVNPDFKAFKDYTWATATVPGIAPTDYVMKFDYKQETTTDAGSNRLWFIADQDVISLYPANGNGEGVWLRVNPQAGDNWTHYDYKFHYALANDTETVYNLYIAKTGAMLIFGIKKNTETDYAWFSYEGSQNSGSGALTFKNADFRADITNFEYYVPNDYVFGTPEYSSVNNQVTVKLDVTRLSSNTQNEALFITAVYQKIGDAEMLYNINATEELKLEYNTPVRFENTVDVPAEGAYIVRSYLWHQYSDLVPITAPFVMNEQI